MNNRAVFWCSILIAGAILIQPIVGEVVHFIYADMVATECAEFRQRFLVREDLYRSQYHASCVLVEMGY
jgi:hypothetical protein